MKKLKDMTISEILNDTLPPNDRLHIAVQIALDVVKNQIIPEGLKLALDVAQKRCAGQTNLPNTEGWALVFSSWPHQEKGRIYNTLKHVMVPNDTHYTPMIIKILNERLTKVEKVLLYGSEDLN